MLAKKLVLFIIIGLFFCRLFYDIEIFEDKVKKFLIAFFVLLASLGLSALSPAFSTAQFLIADDDDDEEESSSEETEEEDESSENSEDSAEESSSEAEEDEEEKAEPEEDPFAKSSSKSKKEKDDFATEPDPDEDDFVVEKREKGVVHHHKEPDLGKISVSTYLYTEASVRSKKLFELYQNDEVVILEEEEKFYKVEFLGKQGWVPRDDVLLEKWYTYRLSLELAGGVGGGKVNRYDIIGSYSLRFNVSIIQDFIAGLEGKMFSFDADNLYYGGGLMLRYYIHGLRTKKTRSAISAAAGYVGGVAMSKTRDNRKTYSFSGGPYASVSLDYFFRVWEYIALGIGGNFTYLRTYSSFHGINENEDLFLGGAHLTLLFNVMR